MLKIPTYCHFISMCVISIISHFFHSTKYGGSKKEREPFVTTQCQPHSACVAKHMEKETMMTMWASQKKRDMLCTKSQIHWDQPR